jgi:hypothetical protein
MGLFGTYFIQIEICRPVESFRVENSTVWIHLQAVKILTTGILDRMSQHFFIVDPLDIVVFEIFTLLEMALDRIICHDVHSILSHRNLGGKKCELSVDDKFLNKAATKLAGNAFALDTKVFDILYFGVFDETNA